MMAGRRGQANPAAILAIAYEMIATKGYTATTTAEICRRAAVSSGTFFHYFPTKESVLLALLEETGPPGETTFSAIIEESLGEAEDPLLPGFVREVARLGSLPRVRALIDQQGRDRSQRLRVALDAARATGQVRGDLDDDQLQLRAEMVINGFEVLLAAGTDPSDCAATMLALLADGLGWRP